ncbi:MAG: hypothetical protein AB7Q81_07165 [Gammaproteobacteria bacterium]
MYLVLAMALGSAVSSGCTGAARPAEFAVAAQPVASRSPLAGQIRLVRLQRAVGDPLWTPELGSSGFVTALAHSLAAAGYLAPNADDATVVVTATVERLDQPLKGINYDVTSKVRYTVSANGEIRDIPIVATGSATLVDHVVAAERLRIASERAVKANIRAFLDKLAAW